MCSKVLLDSGIMARFCQCLGLSSAKLDSGQMLPRAPVIAWEVPRLTLAEQSWSRFSQLGLIVTAQSRLEAKVQLPGDPLSRLTMQEVTVLKGHQPILQ